MCSCFFCWFSTIHLGGLGILQIDDHIFGVNQQPDILGTSIEGRAMCQWRRVPQSSSRSENPQETMGSLIKFIGGRDFDGFLMNIY